MSAIEIKLIDNIVTVTYEEKSRENIKRKLEELRVMIGGDNGSWYNLCPIFNLKAADSSIRLFRRWGRNPETDSSFQEMPETQWKILLMITKGQEPIKPRSENEE